MPMAVAVGAIPAAGTGVPVRYTVTTTGRKMGTGAGPAQAANASAASKPVPHHKLPRIRQDIIDFNRTPPITTFVNVYAGHGELNFRTMPRAAILTYDLAL